MRQMTLIDLKSIDKFQPTFGAQWVEIQTLTHCYSIHTHINTLRPPTANTCHCQTGRSGMLSLSASAKTHHTLLK